jgi:hypothetical protein
MGDAFPKVGFRVSVPVDDLDKQIQFARHDFDNHQSLIRASDAKAAATVTIMVFLAASALQISKDAILKLHTEPRSVLLASTLFALATIGLLVSVLWSFIAVHRVLRPRGARFTAAQRGRELMWQDHVLLHQNSEEYFSAVRAASPELILRNLTDQIFELAHISKEKMDALTNIRVLIWLGFGSWVALIASGFLLGRH